MAFTHVKLTVDAGGNIRMPVTIINPANNKSAKVDIVPDTGATSTAIDNKYARQIGLDINTGTPQKVNGISGFYLHMLKMQIGNLKPIPTPVVIGAYQNFAVNVIGIPTMITFANFRFWRDYVTVTEFGTTPAKATQKKAAYVEAYKSFYSYPRWYTKRI